MNNEAIEEVSYHKHLGIFLSSDGTWHDHINSITSKAWLRVNLMRKLKFLLDRRSLEIIYVSFIRPLLEYADVVWDNCKLYEVNALEKIQLEAARIVTGTTKLVALWFILRGDLLYVFPCVILFLCFSVLLILRLPRLGKRELILVLFVRLFGLCLFRFVSSSSWGLGRAAVCDCGTPWTFLLPFLYPWKCCIRQRDGKPLRSDVLNINCVCFTKWVIIFLQSIYLR